MEVLKHPNEILKAENSVVEDHELKDIIENIVPGMKEIINAEETLGLGLAAPQIGINKKFFVMRTGCDTAHGLDYDNILVVINPEIKKVMSDKTIVFKEGCLSVPDKMCIVPRAKEIKVKFIGEDGKSKTLNLKNTDAVVFQHEYDHLIGLEMMDRAIEVVDLPAPKEEAPIATVTTEETKSVEETAAVVQE
jgi:peptide deformylase